MISPQSTLDYAPLTEPLTAAEVNEYKPLGSSSVYLNSHTIWIIISASIVLMFFVSYLTPYLDGGTNTFFTLVKNYWFLVLIIFLGLVGHVYRSRSNSKKLAAMNKFAIKNDIDFKARSNLVVQLGMIFNQGHTRYFSPQFTMPDGTEIGNYHYTTGSGKHRKDHHWGYARIQLYRNMPHMILDAKHNNMFSRFSNLPELLATDQILSLEGNFDSYFTLYAPKQYERDALYIFTPDVMAKLIDLGKEYDIEIIDNYIYLYRAIPLRLNSAQTWLTILDVTNALGAEIRDQSKQYQDERLTTELGDRVTGAIASQGTRLKRRFNLTATIFIAILFAGYIYLLYFQR